MCDEKNFSTAKDVKNHKDVEDEVRTESFREKTRSDRKGAFSPFFCVFNGNLIVTDL